MTANKAMVEELLAQARSTVGVAVAAGADDAVASVSWGRALEFQYRADKLEKVQEDTSRSLGIALYVDGRFSTHGTNDLDPTRLAAFVSEAVAITRELEPDPYRSITPSELYADRPEVDLDLVDRSLLDLSREERIAWCRQMDEEAHGHEDVVSATSGVTDSAGISARVSSNGFEGAHQRTSVWYGTEVTIREDEVKRPEAWWWVGGSHQEGLPTPPEVGREALRRVLSRRGAEKVPSIRTSMVVDPEAGSGLLGRMMGALTAGAIQQQRSFLSDRKGERIASSLLSITDEPLRKRGPGSRHYDGEGISAKTLPILSEGVLESYFVDTYYGRKLGWEPTTGSASNLVLALGEKDLSGILDSVGEGIYVTSWLGGNANPTTGDFSFGVRGHLIEGGKPGKPISEMNVTGNYLELLDRLVEVGNDPVPWAGFRTPTLVFDGIQFSGA